MNRFAVEALDVMLPPFTASVPSVDILPFDPVIVKWVAAMFPVERAIAVTIVGSDISKAVVTPPPPDDETFIPVGRASFVSALSTSSNWAG